MLSRRTFLQATLASTLPKPNVVIIFLDDSGYSDFHPFGNPPYPTPHVERLAKQGCAFRNFYVPQAICSASRSALLTGCYPGRTRMFGAHGPGARGVDPKFATLGEVLKTAGYRTGVFGKWHIGDQPETRPPARGFDESCGLMYSNDMWEFHPERPQDFPQPLQFWENGQVKIDRVTSEHQPNLTRWYTEHATSFIQRHRASPFFLYVPHSMPHVPIFRSPEFAGKSKHGVYGDVIMELDWSIGQILGALDQAGVADNTLVILTSDNGPWTSYGNHAGSTPYRESKGTGFDGGTRSACLMRYPGKIKAGSVSTKALCTIDLLPTIANLANAKLPANPIDGLNVWPLITAQRGATNPHPYYAFSTGNVFEGVISGDGRWKLHLPHDYRQLTKIGNDGAPGTYRRTEIGLSLYHLERDPYETTNLIDKNPQMAKQLQAYAEEHRRQFYSAP
ncbi:MAG: sulfatase [Bryobacteraceae bacterium]|nr:sulfatase [Bryobacteraceae bacterium]